MTTSFNWSGAAAGGTPINGVAITAGQNAVSAVIDPSADWAAPNVRALAMELELELASDAFVSTDYMLAWYLDQRLDGINYADGDATTTPAMPPNATFLLIGATMIQRPRRVRLLAPARPFKLMLGNRCAIGVTATLKYTVYTPQLV